MTIYNEYFPFNMAISTIAIQPCITGFNLHFPKVSPIVHFPMDFSHFPMSCVFFPWIFAVFPLTNGDYPQHSPLLTTITGEFPFKMVTSTSSL